MEFLDKSVHIKAHHIPEAKEDIVFLNHSFFPAAVLFNSFF